MEGEEEGVWLILSFKLAMFGSGTSDKNANLNVSVLTALIYYANIKFCIAPVQKL